MKLKTSYVMVALVGIIVCLIVFEQIKSYRNTKKVLQLENIISTMGIHANAYLMKIESLKIQDSITQVNISENENHSQHLQTIIDNLKHQETHEKDSVYHLPPSDIVRYFFNWTSDSATLPTKPY